MNTNTDSPDSQEEANIQRIKQSVVRINQLLAEIRAIRESLPDTEGQ